MDVTCIGLEAQEEVDHPLFVRRPGYKDEELITSDSKVQQAQ